MIPGDSAFALLHHSSFTFGGNVSSSLSEEEHGVSEGIYSEPKSCSTRPSDTLSDLPAGKVRLRSWWSLLEIFSHSAIDCTFSGWRYQKFALSQSSVVETETAGDTDGVCLFFRMRESIKGGMACSDMVRSRGPGAMTLLSDRPMYIVRIGGLVTYGWVDRQTGPVQSDKNIQSKSRLDELFIS
jgi:hypothetical protein